MTTVIDGKVLPGAGLVKPVFMTSRKKHFGSFQTSGYGLPRAVAAAVARPLH